MGVKASRFASQSANTGARGEGSARFCELAIHALVDADLDLYVVDTQANVLGGSIGNTDRRRAFRPETETRPSTTPSRERCGALTTGEKAISIGAFAIALLLVRRRRR